MKNTKKLVSILLIGMLAVSACLPASAAYRPLPPACDCDEHWGDCWWNGSWNDNWTGWDDPEYFYDYNIEAEEYEYFYPESSATILHDGHGNFSVGSDVSNVISSDDGFVTVIQPNDTTLNASGGTGMSIDGYPIIPDQWQGAAVGGTFGNDGYVTGGNFTSGAAIVQSSGQLGTLIIRGRTIRVYEGTTDSNMLKGAGHFSPTSAWDGNVCFAGHNRGPNAWFSQLISLNYGDIITYSTALGVRTYQVIGTRIVSVNDLSPLNGSTENMLTLVTCLANQPSVRLIVTAREIG